MKATSRVKHYSYGLGIRSCFWFDVAHAHGHSNLTFSEQYWCSTWLITLMSRWTRDRDQPSASGRTTGITMDSGDNVRFFNVWMVIHWMELRVETPHYGRLVPAMFLWHWSRQKCLQCQR